MIDLDLLADVKRVRRKLLDELLEMQEPGGYWVGELSTSALSTATTCVAFEMLMRAGVTEAAGRELRPLIDGGLDWLAANANDDGGWGDTIKSKSNISTTTLCRAAFTACGHDRISEWATVLERADVWIADATKCHPSLSAAIVARYGKDKTFSVPILMQCALAGVVDWKEIPRLPFELAVLPHKFYAAVKLPVVSYALPALIAIGQLLHNKNPTWVFPLRWLRTASINRTLDKLISLQPGNGGFLEAAPLTGFVTMSLAAAGRADHIVAQRGAEFLVNSVRDDGSWPIDTNLSTWVTTLIVNALGDAAKDELPNPDATLRWLLDQQHTEVHPFTNAAPGGWAWTPLPGGVPDADDTAGAIRALMHLRPRGKTGKGECSISPSEPSTWGATPKASAMGVGLANVDPPEKSPTTPFPSVQGVPPGPTPEEVDRAALAGLRWLASLQNRDGGIPTFCRGWGSLPFDRSSCDITAHAVVALSAALKRWSEDDGSQLSILCKDAGVDPCAVTDWEAYERLAEEHIANTPLGAIASEDLGEIPLEGTSFLGGRQGDDGSWCPLWFGNQGLQIEENPVYGTGRVVIALFQDYYEAWRIAGIENRALPKFLRHSEYDIDEGRVSRQQAIRFLADQINDDCGLGGGSGTTSSVEETSVAAEALVIAAASLGSDLDHLSRRSSGHGTGDMRSWIDPWMYEQPLKYLVSAIDRDEHHDAQPIGFYFAKLWYYEKLYPYAFALGALQAAVDAFDQPDEQGSATPVS